MVSSSGKAGDKCQREMCPEVIYEVDSVVKRDTFEQEIKDNLL